MKAISVEQFTEKSEQNFNYLFASVLSNNKNIESKYLAMSEEERKLFKEMFVVGSAIMASMQLS